MDHAKLKVTGINHVVLHVADLDRSRTFYMEILGFEDRGMSTPTGHAGQLPTLWHAGPRPVRACGP